MSLSGPCMSDPMGELRSQLGNEFIDKVLEALTPAECISMAKEKLSKVEESRSKSMVITKLDEATLWLYTTERKGLLK